MRPVLPASVLLLLLVAQPAFAGIGLSPSDIRFSGMYRGGYAERYFTVSNPGDEDVAVNIAVTGEIERWASIDPQRFILPGKAFAVFKVTVQPPGDTPNDIYTGQMMVVGKPISTLEEGASQVAVASAVAASISVEVSDVQNLQFRVEGASIGETEECRSIIATMNIRNTGNVRVTPHIVFDITDSGGRPVEHYVHDASEILPTLASAEMINIPNRPEGGNCIPQGSYKVAVNSYAGSTLMDKSLLDLNIRPRGQLTISGELIEVLAPTNVSIGETARIDGVFKNTGQLPVSARLAIEVLSGGSIVDTISGDYKDVGLGSIDKLTAYWRPSSPGKYVLRSKAVFEEHETTTRDAVIDVNTPGWWLIAGAAMAAIAMLLLVFFARRRKRREHGGKGRGGRGR